MTKSNLKIKYIQKYNHKTGIMCKCGGECFADGQAVYETPIDVMIAANGGAILKIQYKGWYGPCMDCKKYTLAYISKKKVVKPLSF